jgi:hypothetical protein
VTFPGGEIPRLHFLYSSLKSPITIVS